MAGRLSTDELVEAASCQGLQLLSVLSPVAARARSGRSFAELSSWLDQGYEGEMRYMRERSSKFSSLETFLFGTRSVVVLLVPYSQPQGPSDHEPRYGYARVARYAWGRDYHDVIKERLRRLVSAIEDRYVANDRVRFRAFTDSAPIFERSLAESAQLGFIGKNSLLITPRTGSYNFIATLLWDLEIDGEIAPQVHMSDCGSCTSCLNRCPTGAIVQPGVVDARRCTSYLTIERKTAFNTAEISMVGDWAFGCDICQQVCPFNHRGNTAEVWEEFSPETGVGPWINLLEIFNLRSAQEFTERFTRTPLLRAGRECLIRNCIAVAVNTGFEEAEGALQKLATQDESPYVKFHAKLGLERGYRSQ